MNSRIAFFVCFVFAAAPSLGIPPQGPPPLDPRETHLADLSQLTFQGENAEAYWSPDGRELVMQSTHPPYACDQIFRMRVDGQGEAVRVSTGKGRTTCSYFTKNGDRVLFSSTHAAGDACPPPPDRSHGYVWSIDPSYEIWSARPDGTDLRRVTDNRAYDAESTVCPVDGAVIFTSTRDGDLDLYRMDADGSHVRRLTREPGYDGGAFFSPDCSHIVWRASRPAPGKELEEYRALLAQGLVRPTRLEIYVAKADGTDVHQVTKLGAASFAPSFFPSGKRLLFSSNYGDPQGREFDIWAVDVDGGNLERITWTPGFDGFPLFSPDGTRVAFSSNRRQSAPGETDVFVARWVDAPAQDTAAAGRFHDDVAWLADDAREGRGVGTAGLDAARDWLAARFREIGLAPGGENGGYLQSFDVPVAVEVEAGTAVAVDGRPVERAAFQPASFSGSASGVAAAVVAAGYGITAPDLNVDDYKDVDVKGKIALVRRFVPPGAPFDQESVERRYGDLRFKAWNARDHGAVGLIVVDEPSAPPAAGAEPPPEAALPALKADTSIAATGDAGLPVVFLTRAAGAGLFTGSGHRASLTISLRHVAKPAANIVGVVRAGAAGRLPGAVLVGAHYDHIGKGGAASLAPGSQEIHNGADDNASGTAALLEAARRLVARRGELRRDVWLVAFSGEEEGTLGSTAFTRHPPGGLALGDLTAMLNMDMVGRLRNDALAVLGTDTAPEWGELVPPLCQAHHLTCKLGGDGFGASDQTPFYAAGVPVVHLFTGVHEDYHKPSDDADKINAEGGARVAALMADLAAGVAARPERLTYKSAPAAAPPAGDLRASGASLGTVPDYAGDGRAGVLLAGVRPGSAAEKGGLQRGDLLVELAGAPIRDVHDLMFALRRAKPGEKSIAVVERDGARLPLAVTFEASRSVR
jgi:Tol biopolymer transport system component/S1-C subfamily serine protease